MSADPCQCHQSFAYITNRHGGHCCFFPETQTCHPDEVAAWERERQRQRDERSTASLSKRQGSP